MTTTKEIVFKGDILEVAVYHRDEMVQALFPIHSAAALILHLADAQARHLTTVGSGQMPARAAVSGSNVQYPGSLVHPTQLGAGTFHRAVTGLGDRIAGRVVDFHMDMLAASRREMEIVRFCTVITNPLRCAPPWKWSRS